MKVHQKASKIENIKIRIMYIHAASIKYLNHIINKDSTTCENNFKLSQCPRPTNVKQLQRFLGRTNYLKNYYFV